jgi:ribosome-associated translation inhibitor RaiA
MRIDVLAEDSIIQQARTYAEYRLFAALSEVVDTDRIRHARLILRRTKHKRGCEGASCTVTVNVEGDSVIRVRTHGAHPYAAINRAVERLRDGARAASMRGRLATTIRT